MKKLIFLGLAAATVFAAAPATAQPRGGAYGYDRYDNGYDGRDRRAGRGYNDCNSLSDRNCDGYDDRDLNRDHYIDAREYRLANGGGGGSRGNTSRSDRNGDGFDDRDLNRDGWISPREAQIGVRETRRGRRY